jgi:hypothetical protein
VCNPKHQTWRQGHPAFLFGNGAIPAAKRGEDMRSGGAYRGHIGQMMRLIRR